MRCLSKALFQGLNSNLKIRYLLSSFKIAKSRKILEKCVKYVKYANVRRKSFISSMFSRKIFDDTPTKLN